MTRISTRALGSACLLLFALTAVACGDDDGPSVTDAPAADADADGTTTSTSAPDAEDASQVVREYFMLLGANNLGDMPRMLDLSTPGSPAHLYARHQIAGTRALGPSTATVEFGDDSVETCIDGYNAAGQTEQLCYTYADFTADPDTGLLETFSVNGNPVADRIRAGDEQGASSQGVTVNVVTAYLTALGDVMLNLDVTNSLTTPLNVTDYDFQYVDTSGRQFAPSQDFFSQLPSEIQPGATAPVLAAFSQAPFGGTFTFVGFTNEFMTGVRVEVPVAP
jgi:hypothetical protein